VIVSRRGADAVATAASRLLMIAGAVSVIEILTHDWRPIGYVADAIGVLGFPADRSLYVACLVFLLAGAVRRRFRLAYGALVAVMAVNLAGLVTLVVRAHRDHRHDYRLYDSWHESPAFAWTALIVGTISFVVVACSYRAFTARLARRSIPTALGVVVGGMALSFLLTLGLTFAFPHTLVGTREKVRWAAMATVGDHVSTHSPYFTGHIGHHWVFALAGAASAAALLLGVLVLSRANHANQFLSREDELQVRRLLAAHGDDDSLGYFATRRDKSVVFSADRSAAILFRVIGSVSVASADPIGDRNSWSAAITTWLQNCREHSVHAAVIAASADGARAYRDAGLRTLDMGDEAIIDVDQFTLRGPAMKPVRQAVNRVTAAGYTVRVRRHGELGAAEAAEIAEVAERWRGEDVERGFSMALNRLGDPVDGDCLLVTAHDAGGTIRGLLSFVPWGSRGVSLDLMRRDRAGENGIIEFMVAGLVDRCGQTGIDRISLNFAMFRSVYANADRVGAGPITRGTDALLGFASRFYQLEQLYRSNQKYQPTWIPRVLCYQPPLSVLRASIASGIAEGFLPKLGPAFLTGPGVPKDQEVRDDAEFLAAVAGIERAARCRATREPRRGDQHRARLAKRATLEGLGMPAHPLAVPRDTDIGCLVEEYTGLAAGTHTGKTVSVVGRARAVRDFGGLVFVDVEEGGARLQLLSDDASSPAHRALRAGVDVGDLISATGEVCTSLTGELSLRVDHWQLAAKCLHPIPAAGTRLSDEVRARDRTLDLLTTTGATDLLIKRSRGVAAVRRTLQDKGFLEVETPILQTVHGGAAARPFTTHINAYDMRLSLRIAPELFLKRLAVAGLPKIFELGRNFRNEGVDATHNPEFTSLEVYQAHADYHTMATLVHELVVAAAVAVNGTAVVYRDGVGVDLADDWPQITVHRAVSRATGTALTPDTHAGEVAQVCAAHGVEYGDGATAGQLIMKLYETLVEKQTQRPTFYFDFPIEVSPLARPHADDPRLTQQWDLVTFGSELATAYSELTDPIDQRQRLVEQSLAAAGGDPEAMALDEDFVRALGYGMPPTGGLGVGVDRLLMMLLHVPIRSTLSFPFVKPDRTDTRRGSDLP